MRELNKADNQKCKHQGHKGCAVYRRRDFGEAMAVRELEKRGIQQAMPACCSLWNCRWLVQPEDTRDLRRPDRSGYVIDIMPDFITTVDNETGATRDIQVVQVWCDPKRPDAYRDPALLAYLERRADEGIAALIRYSADEAFVLAAPRWNETGKWKPMTGITAGRTHTAQEVIDHLEGEGRIQFMGGKHATS